MKVCHRGKAIIHSLSHPIHGDEDRCMIAFPVRLSIYKRSPPYLALLYTQGKGCTVAKGRVSANQAHHGKGIQSELPATQYILQLQKLLLVCGRPQANVLALNSVEAVLPEKYNYSYLALRL